MHKYILHIIVLLFTVFNVTAQVSFEARVSKKSMGLNERLRVDFIMNKNGDNFTAKARKLIDYDFLPNQDVGPALKLASTLSQ